MYCQARRGCLAIEGLSEKSKEAFVSRKNNLAAHCPVNKGNIHPDESGLLKNFKLFFILVSSVEELTFLY